MTNLMTDDVGPSQTDQAVLKRTFLIGQPVDLGNFGVLRMALEIHAVCLMQRHGVEKALADDVALLKNLSLLAKYYDKIDGCQTVIMPAVRRKAC